MIHQTHHSFDRVDRKRKERFSLRINFFLRLFFVILLPFGLVCSGIYFFLFSSLFMIDHVVLDVQGVDQGTVRSILFKQMDESFFHLFGQRNIFFFSVPEAKKKLQENFAVQSLNLSKKYPNTLAGALNGMPFSAFWFTQNKMYALNNEGVIIKELNPLALGPVPQFLKDHFVELLREAPVTVIHTQDKDKNQKLKLPLFLVDESQIPIQIGSNVFTQEKLETLRNLFINIYSFGFSPVGVFLKGKEEGVRIQTFEGTEFIMSLDDKSDIQIHRLSTLLENKLQQEKKNIKSIDTRFGNKLYYTVK